MFKQLITNKVLLGIGKIALISTVGIGTATSGALLYENLSNNQNSSNEQNVDSTESYVANETTPESNDTTDIDDTETSSSKSNTDQGSSINEFVTDIITSASKIITESINGNTGSNPTVDVNTSSSKQNSPVTVGVTPLPVEDTNTGSSRTVSVGGTLIYIDDEDENEYEDKFEVDDEDDKHEDKEDEHEDKDDEQEEEHEDEEDED